jgi:putative transcriptional regulator
MNHEEASLFERLKKGLQDSAAYSRGQLNLRTTALPLPPRPASARQVAALRRRLGMSQSLFAATLNVSPKLVQSWEQGLRTPQRGDLRLIQIIQQNPAIIRVLFAQSGQRPLAPEARGSKPRRNNQTSTAA